jgi:hypothetical protein
MAPPVHSEQRSVSHDPVHESNKWIEHDFEKCPLDCGPPLRNRTVDLLLTISTLCRPERTACTDSPPGCTECPHCTGSRPGPVHDPVHGVWNQPLNPITLRHNILPAPGAVQAPLSQAADPAPQHRHSDRQLPAARSAVPARRQSLPRQKAADATQLTPQLVIDRSTAHREQPCSLGCLRVGRRRVHDPDKVPGIVDGVPRSARRW